MPTSRYGVDKSLSQRASRTGSTSAAERHTRARYGPGSHNVYVVELDPKVRDLKRFAKANPNARADKPCLYVGSTGLSPTERFDCHKKGIKASRFVRDYGLRLRPQFYQRFNPMPYDEAVRMERELARRLRARGFSVWQN